MSPRLVRHARSAIAVAACVIAVLASSGCTVQRGAVMGVGVDASGHLEGYIKVCKGQIDGATVYLPFEGADGTTVGRWTADAPITDYASWSMELPTDGWTTNQKLPAIKPHTQYEFYGWTKDNSFSAMGGAFTQTRVRAMQPGMVSYDAAVTDSTTGKETWSTVHVSVEQFRRDACAALAATYG